MNLGGFARSMLRLLKRVFCILWLICYVLKQCSELFCSPWMTVCFKMKPWRSVNVHLCSWFRSDMYRWCHGHPQVDTLNVLFGGHFGSRPLMLPHVQLSDLISAESWSNSHETNCFSLWVTCGSFTPCVGQNNRPAISNNWLRWWI